MHSMEARKCKVIRMVEMGTGVKLGLASLMCRTLASLSTGYLSTLLFLGEL